MARAAGYNKFVVYGFYCASKFVMVGITEALRDELKHFGITITIIEPGYFRTNFLSACVKITAKNVIEDLKAVMDPLTSTFEAHDGTQPGDPVKEAELLVKALAGTDWRTNCVLPPRPAIRNDAVHVITGILENEKRDLDAWKDLSATTDYDS